MSMRKAIAMTAAGVLLLFLALPFGVHAEDSRAQGMRAVVHRTPPNYPEIARRLNLCGVVMVKVAVAADGHVKSTSVVSGNPILGQAASTAVREWIFAPGAEESVTVGVTFNLRQ
jgi:TonB family protein